MTTPATPEPPASHRIAALHAAGATNQANKLSRIEIAPWDDLTWWEKRQRFQLEMQRIKPRFKKGEVRALVVQHDKRITVHPVRNEKAIVHDGQDGKGYHVIPKAIAWLDRDVKAGPITIHFEDNPQAIWEQTPKGWTTVHMRAFSGGTLRAAIERGNKDVFKLKKSGLWLILGLAATGLVAIILWLWYRGVF